MPLENEPSEDSGPSKANGGLRWRHAAAAVAIVATLVIVARRDRPGVHSLPGARLGATAGPNTSVPLDLGAPQRPTAAIDDASKKQLVAAEQALARGDIKSAAQGANALLEQLRGKQGAAPEAAARAQLVLSRVAFVNLRGLQATVSGDGGQLATTLAEQQQMFLAARAGLTEAANEAPLPDIGCAYRQLAAIEASVAGRYLAARKGVLTSQPDDAARLAKATRALLRSAEQDLRRGARLAAKGCSVEEVLVRERVRKVKLRIDAGDPPSR